MYDEKTFSNYLFWLKVKRIVLIILFSVAGAIAGIIISDFVVNILMSASKYRILIITVSTMIFFALALLCTTGTAEKVQEGYWRMAMLRKLTIISKKLDVLVEENDHRVVGLLAEPKGDKSSSKTKKSSGIKDFDDDDEKLEDDSDDVDESDDE